MGNGRGAGVRGHVDTGYGLCLGVWLGPTATAVGGHLLDLGRHQGLVSGWGRHWLPVVLLRPGRGGGSLEGPGWGIRVVLECGAWRLCGGAFCHEGGCGGVSDGGGALCRVLLLQSAWLQGLEVVEEVRWGLSLRWRLGAGLGLSLLLGAVAMGFGCCLAVGFDGGWALGCGVGAGFGFGCAAGAGFAGVHCRPAMPVTWPEAAGDLAVLGTLVAMMGFRAHSGGIARSLGGGVLCEGVVVEVDEVVVVVEVVELGWEALVEEVEGFDWEDVEAEETDVGDAGAGCWVLWASRLRVRARASHLCARFPTCPVCVQVPVPAAVSCLARGGVVELSWKCGSVSYPGGVHISSRTCGSDCCMQWNVLKKANCMPGMSSSVRWGYCSMGVSSWHSRIMRRAATMKGLLEVTIYLHLSTQSSYVLGTYGWAQN